MYDRSNFTKLGQAEVELSRGLRVPQVCEKLGIGEQPYDRWRKEYGGLRLDLKGCPEARANSEV